MPKKSEHYAYGDDRAEVEAIMRLSAVKRWHMVSTRGSQNLADHSAVVAALAFLVAMKSPGAFFGDPAEATLKGLFHDIPEVFTGDFPSHSKQWFDRGELQRMEEEVTPDVFLMTQAVPRHISLMVKLCDLADSIRFIRLNGVDMTAPHALRGLEQQMCAKCEEARAAWPPVVYSAAIDIIEFYAYETRNSTSGTAKRRSEGPVENDMARGPGSEPGGSGPFVRDATAKRLRVPVRDRVDGVEGDPAAPSGPPM